MTLHIYGPPRTGEVVAGIMAMLAPDLEYRVGHHADLTWTPQLAVHELDAPCELVIGDAAISVRATDHRPVEPTVGYRVEHDGRIVAIAGDSIPCAGLDELCSGAHLSVQTVIREDLVRLVPVSRLQDILDYHSSIERGGPAGCVAGAGRDALRGNRRPRRRLRSRQRDAATNGVFLFVEGRPAGRRPRRDRFCQRVGSVTGRGRRRARRPCPSPTTRDFRDR